MNKKLLLLLWGYTAWVIATLLYNKKNPSEIKSELEQAKDSWEDNIKVFFNNFIEIHKNLLDSCKSKVLTQENKLIFEKKKWELLKFAEDYKQKAEVLFQQYSVKWKDYAEEWLEKLEKFYNEALEDLETLKQQAPEKFDQAKTKVTSYFEEFKSKFKKVS